MSWVLRRLGLINNRDTPNTTTSSTKIALGSNARNNANMSESIHSFIPGHDDVSDVKSILWKKNLPAELIDFIIDIAEYWPRLVTEVESNTAVGRNSQFLYLRTEPLPGLFIPESSGEGMSEQQMVIGEVEARTLHPARKVIFKIWSHDQGWSSHPGRGTYEGSHTWFETFSERPVSIAAVQNATPLPSPVDITEESKLQELQFLNEELAWKTISIPQVTKGEDGSEDVPMEKKTWHIQRNVHADGALKKHEISWSWTDSDEDELAYQDVDITGAGRGGDLVRNLKSGDRLSVVARAMYPGWVNNVERMQLETFYAI